MANLFETPVAANPMSEFVGLPLDFIQKTMERRQSKYDTAKADIEAQEESLLGLKFLPGDRDRHMEIQGQYDARLDKMIEDAGGDYSTIQGSLDRYKRDLNRETKFGELGAQGSAYASAMGKSKKLDDMLTEGKVSEGGMAKFQQSMQSHKTTQNSAGGFNSFSGYTPSSEMNPLKIVHDTVDEINAEFNQSGMKGVNKDRIMNAINNLRLTNPNIDKALLEQYSTQGHDPTKVSPKDYIDTVISGVVDAKQYQEQMKDQTGQGGNFADTTIQGVQMPESSKGNMKMKGNSMAWLKEQFGATTEADTFMKSQDGIELKKALESRMGTPMPQGHAARAAWIEEASSKDRTQDVQISGDISQVKGTVINGQLMNPEAYRVNMSGQPVSAEYVMEGTKGEMKVRTRGIVTKGPYKGYIALVTPKGETIFEENANPEVLGSKDYILNQIDQVKHTLTHNKTVDLYGMHGVQGGVYEAKYNSDTGYTSLYQNGEKMYIYYTDADGKQTIGAIKKK
jgi:hypothetical protein